MKKTTFKLIAVLLLCALVIPFAAGITVFAERSVSYEYRGSALNKDYDGNPVKLSLSDVYTDDNGAIGVLSKLSGSGLYDKYIVAYYRDSASGLIPCQLTGSFENQVIEGPTDPGEYQFVFMRPDNWEDSSEFLTVDFKINNLTNKVVAALNGNRYVFNGISLYLDEIDEIPALTFVLNGNEETLPLTFYSNKLTSAGYELIGASECPAEGSIITVAKDGSSVKVEGFTDNEHVKYKALNGTYVFPTPDAKIISDVKVPTENAIVNITSSVKNNAFSATLSDEKLESAVKITEEEKANGVWVWMEMSLQTKESASSADVALIGAALKDSAKVAAYLNIDIFKQAVGKEKVRVTETTAPLTISVVVPSELRSQYSSFAIAYTHNGGAAKIVNPLSYDAKTGVLTFNANEFSTYALISTSNAPQTGDAGTTFMLVTVLFSAVALAGAVHIRRQKQN